MAKNFTPKIDIAFKKLFGVEENKDILMSLINSIVSEKDQVSDITLLNPYNSQNFRNDKLSILDIKAKNVLSKKLFNIEIQINYEKDYDKRALYYWGKLYTEQLQAKGRYDALAKAIGIHILNFNSIPNVAKYHNTFHITEKEEGFPYFADLELHTIELSKFCDNDNEELSDLVKRVKSKLDIWVAFLTRYDLLNKDKLPTVLEDNDLKKAIGALDVMNFTEEERNAYEEHIKWYRMEADALDSKFEEGKLEGIEVGKLETAKMMLKKGFSIEDITEITCLPLEKIRELID